MFTKEKLNTIFDSFSGLKVLIIGDVMIDSYIWGQVKRLSPEAPVPIVNVVKRENRLGGAANVAKNIKSLGAVPILCSFIGDDDKSDLFYKLLEEEKMPSHGILKSKNRLTTVKFRVIGNNAQMLRVDEETENAISKEETNLLLKHIEAIIEKEKIDVVVFEDYDKGVITEHLITESVKLIQSHNIPVVVDPKRNNFFNYKNVSLFKPNFKEFCEGLKTEIKHDDDEMLSTEISTFQKKQNIKTVLVSLSERGVLVSEKKDDKFNTLRILAHFRNIADVSGAGDTLISVAALCMALKLDAVAVASLSNLAGGIVCEYVGVVPVDKTKFLNEAVKLLTA